MLHNYKGESIKEDPNQQLKKATAKLTDGEELEKVTNSAETVTNSNTEDIPSEQDQAEEEKDAPLNNLRDAVNDDESILPSGEDSDAMTPENTN